MEEVIQYVPNLYATFWALIPPLVAIILALITKEVYSSLFVGIVIGGLFYGNIFQSGFSFEKSVLHIFEDGLVGVLSDPYNVGILVFLVVLGIMVCMMNKAVALQHLENGLEDILRQELEHSLLRCFLEFLYLLMIILTVLLLEALCVR